MRARASWLVFGIGSALAVGAGAAVLASAGFPVSVWARNPLAWLVSALAALAVARLDRPSSFATVITIGVIALAATFAARPVQDVHRWLDFGPLHINAAALVLPALIAALARMEHARFQLAVVAVTGAILVLQPDASQATAFAAAAAVLQLTPSRSPLGKLSAALICAIVAGAGWLRPDTLEPVAAVEGIFALAAEVSIILSAIAAVGLGLACVAPLAGARASGSTTGAFALVIYFSISALAPLFGAYPVPLVGLGMSFPLGWWLGIALAAPRVRNPVR